VALIAAVSGRLLS